MVEVIGHRGAAGIEPENTILSIQRAIELGVDRVEVDVHLTKDGELVIIHDEKVDRTTNGHGYVRDLTFEEIRKLDAGKGERVPTLKEALQLTIGRVILQVELKGQGTAEPVVRTVEEMGAEDWVIITSFNLNMLKEVHKLNPEIETGLLVVKPRNNLLQKAIDLGAKAIHVNYEHINEEFVNLAHIRGLKVCVWNPDTEDAMLKMVKLGADAIGSNRPDILIDMLKKFRA